MIKTIFIIWEERLDIQRGGVHRIINMLLEQLPQHGYNVHYLYTTDDYKSFHHYQSINEATPIPLSNLQSLLNEFHCDLIIGQDAVLSSRLSQIIQQWNNPDIKYISVYHSSIFLLENALSRNYWIWLLKHDRSIVSKALALARLAVYPLWKKQCRKTEIELFQKNYDIADKLIILSKRELSEIKALIHEEIPKCTVINNPLTWEKIEDPGIIPHKKKEVLIVSRLYNPEKRLDRALYIWKQLEKKGFMDWKLRIVGSGPHENYLHDLAQKLKIKNIEFTGRQNPYPYYLAASLFMMTSAVEGWGLTLTESMQTATVPIVFDSYPALHDIITNNYDGVIIKDDDFDSYISHMAQLMSHQDERERIARNGLESCRRFTIDKIVHQWVDLIKSL